MEQTEEEIKRFLTMCQKSDNIQALWEPKPFDQMTYLDSNEILLFDQHFDLNPGDDDSDDCGSTNFWRIENGKAMSDESSFDRYEYNELGFGGKYNWIPRLTQLYDIYASQTMFKNHIDCVLHLANRLKFNGIGAESRTTEEFVIIFIHCEIWNKKWDQNHWTELVDA